jgi:hypothetical protein
MHIIAKALPSSAMICRIHRQCNRLHAELMQRSISKKADDCECVLAGGNGIHFEKVPESGVVRSRIWQHMDFVGSDSCAIDLTKVTAFKVG